MTHEGVKPRAITLDAAGTLIYPARPVAESYRQIALAHGADLDAKALAHGFREAFVAMPPMAFPRAEAATLERLERDWWRRLVQVVTAAAGGVEAFDAYFDELYSYFAAGAAWRLYPEVTEVLGALSKRGVPLAVVSNFDSRLMRVLDELGVAGRFEAIIYSTGAGSAKPDADIFTHALTALQCPAQYAMHVGDNADADCDGARACGMQTILLRRGSAGPKGPHEARDLRVLMDVDF